MDRLNFLFDQYYKTFAHQESNMISHYLLSYPSILEKLKKENTTESKTKLGYLYFLKGDYVNMKQYLMSAIKDGSTNAMLMYGKYCTNIIVNIPEAKKYFFMANNSMAYNLLGTYYYNSYNNKEAEKYLKLGATIPRGMLTLSLYYLHRAKKYDIAKKWMEKALESGATFAYLYFGLYYQKIGNAELMIEMFNKAIEFNHSFAMYELATYYGNVANYSQMKKYYLMAIKYHNMYAIDGLACYYIYNNKDSVLAEKYLNMGAELNYGNVLQTYGNYYYTSNSTLAEKYYIKSIQLGQFDSYVDLADLYEYKKNVKMYNKYMKIALNLKIGYAYYRYGYNQYRIGNYKEALKCYKKSIELDNEFGMYYYGLYHQHVTRNYKMMEKYYLMVINKLGGSSMAKSWTCEAYGNYFRWLVKDYKKMEDYYLKAIALTNTAAKKNYEEYLLTGK